MECHQATGSGQPIWHVWLQAGWGMYWLMMTTVSLWILFMLTNRNIACVIILHFLVMLTQCVSPCCIFDAKHIQVCNLESLRLSNVVTKTNLLGSHHHIVNFLWLNDIYIYICISKLSHLHLQSWLVSYLLLTINRRNAVFLLIE